MTEYIFVCPHCESTVFESFIVPGGTGDYTGMTGYEMARRCLDCKRTFVRPKRITTAPDADAGDGDGNESEE